MSIENENLGDINRITTILGMDNKRLLHQECINELMSKARSLCKVMIANHEDTLWVNQMETDISSYKNDGRSIFLDKIRHDLKGLLSSLTAKKFNNNGLNLKINDYIKLLQKQ